MCHPHPDVQLGVREALASHIEDERHFQKIASFYDVGVGEQDFLFIWGLHTDQQLVLDRPLVGDPVSQAERVLDFCEGQSMILLVHLWVCELLFSYRSIAFRLLA